jgi:CheY-like chemotaxis protein
VTTATARLGFSPGISVLVIEDHQDTAEMFESYLRYCGAELVTIVRDAESALAYLNGQHIDAITTDLSVQPEHAVDFVSQVRSRPEYEKTPIIAVSGWTAKSFDPVAVGFTAFLLKPIDLDQLVGTIRSLVAGNGSNGGNGAKAGPRRRAWP